MEEIQEKKADIRNLAMKQLEAMSAEKIQEKTRQIEERLFDFANFLEARIALLYINSPYEVDTGEILKKTISNRKILVLPLFSHFTGEAKLLKVDNLSTDLTETDPGRLSPDPARCKAVPIDCIDIAVIPGLAFDEKGGRLGPGDGYYDRLIPRLPATTRKVSLAFEEQIFPQIPMDSHDRHMDIIITEKRTIYKI